MLRKVFLFVYFFFFFCLCPGGELRCTFPSWAKLMKVKGNTWRHGAKREKCLPTLEGRALSPMSEVTQRKNSADQTRRKRDTWQQFHRSVVGVPYNNTLNVGSIQTIRFSRNELKQTSFFVAYFLFLLPFPLGARISLYIRTMKGFCEVVLLWLAG